MKLDSIQAACPVAVYDVQVSHHVERRPNTIEWAILQAMQVANTHPEYGASTVEEIFTTFFGFPEDLDLLLKPLFSRMFGDGVITSPTWNDQSSLGDFYMRDFQFTPKGMAFLRDGRLPVKSEESPVQIFYDIEKGTLLPDKFPCSEEPRGLALADAAQLQTLPLPPQTLDAAIDRHRKKHNRAPWDWLTPQTHIDDKHADETPAIRWRTVQRDITLTPDFEAVITGVTDERIVQAALQSLDFGSASGRGLPCLTPQALDGVRAIHPLLEEEALLRASVAQSRDWCLLSIHQAGLLPDGTAAPRLTVLFNAPAFAIHVDVKTRRIRMELPEPMPSGALLRGNQGAWNAGLLPVHAGSYERELPILYAPANAFDFPAWAKEAAARYAPQDIRALLLLAASHQMATLHIMSQQVLEAMPKAAQAAANTRLQKDIHNLYGYKNRKGNAA